MNTTTNEREFTRMRNCFMKRLSIILTLAVVLSSASAMRAADYAAQVQNLIPRLADADVPARYAAQMELQDLASNSSKSGNEEARGALGRVLADFASDGDVAQPARVWIVRQLEYMGGEEAVPALTALLADEDAELRECARRALEKNSSRPASQSLREALEKVASDQDESAVRWKIGLMNSLAERGDVRAVELIVPHLKKEATATAAAHALGRNGSSGAIEALVAVMNDFPEASLALVEAAQRGGNDGMRAMRAVFDRSTYAPARAAALARLVRLMPNNASDLIDRGLDGTDPNLRHAALNAAEAMGPAFMPVLAAMLPRLSPVASVQVIGRLGQSVEPQIIKAVDDPDDDVRTMAVKRLGQVGSAASVGALLEAAADNQRGGAGEAKDALVAIRGKDAVEAIQAIAGNASSGVLVRVAAIDALVARETPEALPVLRRCVTEPGRVGSAAVAGLGRLGGSSELLPLARVALERQSDEAFAALEQVAGRVEDGAVGAGALIDLAGGSERAMLVLLDTLGTLGGPDALKAVSGFLSGSQADAAIRALAKWPDLGSAETLLKVASEGQAQAGRRALAFNGLLDLLRNSENVPATERGEMVLAAWNATRDNDEKKRVLSVMGGIPDGRLAETIKPLFESEDFKAEAIAAATGLAEGLLETDRDAAKELARAVQATEPPNAVSRRLGRILRN